MKTAKELGLIFTFEGDILHKFAAIDNAKSLEKYLDYGCHGNIESVDKKGRTVLHIAAKKGSLNCVKLLLKRGADPNAISGIEDHCSTPLHHAVARGHITCVDTLLEYEVNLELKNSMGKKAIDLAIETNTSDSLRCANRIKRVIDEQEKKIENDKAEALFDLVSVGDFQNSKHTLESIKDPYSIINKYFRGCNTLLYRASFHGYKDIVQLLIDYRADGRPNSGSGLTPLYTACYQGHYDVVVLLSKVFPKNLALPLVLDQTYPLHACIMKGREYIVEYLLTLRKPYVSDSAEPMNLSTGATPRSSILNATQEYYVEINKPTGNGLTPLHIAVMYGNLNILKMLLKCKPYIKETEEEKYPGCLVIDKVCDTKTAFHLALVGDNQNSLKCAEILLENGANFQTKFEDDQSWCTPLEYACKNEKVEFVKLLLKHKVEDVGGCALQEAMQNDKDAVVNELLRDGVFINEESKLVVAACELDRRLNPVSISWKNRHIKNIKDKWILNAALMMNSHLGDFVKENISLQIKVITHIVLSENSLESVPIILFQLPSLKKLNLSHNKLTELPCEIDDNSDPFLSSKKDYESNNLSMNWNCPSLEELELQYNSLKTLPKNVFRMPMLQVVNCGYNQISDLPFEMWIAESLKTLVLEHNCLTNLPIFVSDECITRFRLNQVKRNGKKNFKNEKEAEKIDDRSKKNAFATSREFLYSKRPTWEGESDDSDDDEFDYLKKSGLNKLDLSCNQLTKIPLGLACLAPNLAKLNLSHNKISEVDCVNLFPEHLSSLELAENNMKIFNLSNIGNLGCYMLVKKQVRQRVSFSNEIFLCQHRKHRELNELLRLDLSKNCLESIGLLVTTVNHKSQVFCRNLKSLDISHNKLNNLPAGIGKLTKLETLIANHNPNISTLPFELGLCSEIYVLTLDNVHLKQLPKYIVENYDRNKDYKALIRHLKSLHDNAVPFPNIKLMLVGIHGIGKTALLMLLRREGYGSYQQPEYKLHFSDRLIDKSSNKATSNLSTVGVDVCDWEYGKKPIKFSTWDFAGQSEYYATHQCFLSQRAIYLLIWRLTDALDGIMQLESWLLNIQSRAPNATVLIVGTHADKVDKTVCENYRKVIKEKFISLKNGGSILNPQDKGLPNVVDVIEVSCETSYNIQKLRDLIYNTAMNIKGSGKEAGICLMEQSVPASYIAVEKAISTIASKMKDDIPVLNAKTFRSKVYEQLQLQKAELKNGDEELDQAVHFLHDYGTLLHFDDPTLNDLYFINPQWLCDLLAHIITVKNVNPCIKNGLLKISDLQHQIFHGSRQFPTSMISKYIELLNRFDVAIKISDKFLLVPSLFPDQQKECLIVAENQSSLLQNAMNISTYLQCEVFRRQYLLTYVPSGLWARLLTRLIADDRICKIVSLCCEVQGQNNVDENQILMKAAPPEWACWKTGIELSCFGIKLLRVCQLEPEVAFYGSNASSTCVFVKNPTVDSSQRVTIEIIAPSVTLKIDKFILNQSGSNQSESQDQSMVGFRVKSVHYNSHLNACKLLVLTIEHIDNLLAEWYPQLDRLIDAHGIKAVRRVSFCNKCLQSAIFTSNTNANASFLLNFSSDLSEDEIEKLKGIYESKKKCIVAFELEQGAKNLKESNELICPFHINVEIKSIFPDLCFLDIEVEYVLNETQIKRGKFIAKGGFGDVFAAEIIRGDSCVTAAMKVPGCSEKDQPLMATMLSYDAYKSIRQEISILVTLHHEHIVKFFGVASKPFAIFLELAPKGALSNCLDDFLSAGKRLSPHTITESLKQVSSALKFLHHRRIIYRDLKCDNILVRKFPDPSVEVFSVAQVHLMLTDYGISRSVSIAGNKGLQGTPGYIAPEIIKYSGKESYSDKVDCFSFGSFIYELLTLHRPFYNFSNMHLVKQYMLDGKRPKLTHTEKKYPVLMLSLMYRCWSHNPDDRPTSSEINSLTSLHEFQSLLDILGLGDHFDLQCIVTSYPSMCSHNVVSSKNLIGSHLWFCGSSNNQLSHCLEGVITIFSYNNYKYTHVVNLQLKEKVLVACSVGSTMWLGTELGSIKVYCALTYKLLAVGDCSRFGYILCIAHCPMFNYVVLTFSNSSLLTFSDNLSSYNCIQSCGDTSVSSSPHPVTKIIELLSLKTCSFKTPIHSIAIVRSKAAKYSSKTDLTQTEERTENEILNSNNSETSNSSEVFELWCGQEKGHILILEAKTLNLIQLLPIKTGDLLSSSLNDLTVTFLETPRSYDLYTQNKKVNDSAASSNIWMVAFPGTQVERWNVDTRTIEGVFDASQHVVSLTLNCAKTSKKNKITKVCDAQIQSLVVVENKMYVGTSFGSFFTCDAYTMIPYTWLRCYQELISFIIPFRMKTDPNENEEKFILTCGQKCFDHWLRNFDRKKVTSSKEMTVLTWSTKNL